MGEIDKSLDKAIDDHLKRVFDQYKANTKIFTATHVGHIIVSIVFLFSILFPFLYLQIESRGNDLAVAQLSEKMMRQKQRIAAYRQAKSGLTKVFGMVENAPQRLQEFIQSLVSEAAGGPAAEYPEGLEKGSDLSCRPPKNTNDWMLCRIRGYMTDRFAQNRRILMEEVAAPLQKMHITEFDPWRSDLQTGLKDLLERSKKEFAANPVFWKDFDADSPMYRSMVQNGQEFRVNHRFEEIDEKMSLETNSLQGEVDALRRKKEDIRKKKDTLDSSLKGFKTRFGKIGLELDQAILIAPIVFSILFVLAVVNLMRSVRLRGSFQTLMQRFKDPEKVAITDNEIALTMPLWIDPLDPPAKRKLHAFVLMIPMIAAVVTVAVIVYCMLIPGAFPGMSSIDYWKTFVYYLVSAGLFLHGFRSMIGAVKGHGGITGAH